MGGYSSSALFNNGSISLVFKEGQSVSLGVWVLPIVVDGVYQAVTGGSLRQPKPYLFDF